MYIQTVVVNGISAINSMTLTYINHLSEDSWMNPDTMGPLWEKSLKN